MSKPLQEQNWTLTSSLEERNAILDLASGLGFKTYGRNLDHNEIPQIWVPYTDTVCACIIDLPSLNFQLSVPDFIAGMYALAKERKEKSQSGDNIIKPCANAQDGGKWVDVMAITNDLEERVSDLEKDKGAWEAVINSHTKRIIDSEERIKKLEEAAANPTPSSQSGLKGCKVYYQDGRVGEVIEEGDSFITIQVPSGPAGKPLEKIPSEPWFKIRGNGYIFDFDPKASPKNIPFSVALEYLKAGRKIRREIWGDTDRIEHRGRSINRIYGASIERGTYVAYPTDLLATDWMVVPE